MNHPELGENMNELISQIQNSEVGLVLCEGCGCNRMVNSAYLPYLNGSMKSCRFCRDGEFSSK